MPVRCWISKPQIGHLATFEEQPLHAMACPQGRCTTWIYSSKHILHSKRSCISSHRCLSESVYKPLKCSTCLESVWTSSSRRFFSNFHQHIDRHKTKKDGPNSLGACLLGTQKMCIFNRLGFVVYNRDVSSPLWFVQTIIIVIQEFFKCPKKWLHLKSHRVYE